MVLSKNAKKIYEYNNKYYARICGDEEIQDNKITCYNGKDFKGFVMHEDGEIYLVMVFIPVTSNHLHNRARILRSVLFGLGLTQRVIDTKDILHTYPHSHILSELDHRLIEIQFMDKLLPNTNLEILKDVLKVHSD